MTVVSQCKQGAIKKGVKRFVLVTSIGTGDSKDAPPQQVQQPSHPIGHFLLVSAHALPLQAALAGPSAGPLWAHCLFADGQAQRVVLKPIEFR